MHAHREKRNRGEILDLDHYLLGDPHTQRVRFTRTGQKALAARFAQSGVNLGRLRTLEAVKDAIAWVTQCEYHRLPAREQKDDAAVDVIHDLNFIVDGLTGQPLVPLRERRQRRHQAFEALLAALGMTPEPLFDAPQD